MQNWTSRRIVYFNGRFIPEAEARVSIFDSALMYGDMAFEMTRTYNRQPFKLRDHLDRLYGSLRLLEIDCGLSLDEMERITLETLDRNLPTEAADMDWQIMHDVSRGPLDVYRTAFPEPRNILLGVSRATTIELARELGIPVRETNLGRYEALRADEIFCTATTYALVHATTFEGQRIGTGDVGPVFVRLLEAWQRLVGVDFVAQARDYAERLPAWEKNAGK